MSKNPRLRKREFSIDSRKTNIAVSIIGIGVSLVLAGVMYMNLDSYQLKYDTAKTELANLKGELNDLKGETDNVTVKEVQQRLNSATTIGNQVTELQNTWNTALTAEDNDAFAKSEYESVDALNTTRISRLKLLFSDNAGSQAGARNWYPMIKDTQSAKAKWKFITTTSFTTVKQNVMWQCFGESGELYAYVTAVYNSDKNVFEDVSVNITEAGIEAQTPTKGE